MPVVQVSSLSFWGCVLGTGYVGVCHAGDCTLQKVRPAYASSFAVTELLATTHSYGLCHLPLPGGHFAQRSYSTPHSKGADVILFPEISLSSASQAFATSSLHPQVCPDALETATWAGTSRCTW